MRFLKVFISQSAWQHSPWCPDQWISTRGLRITWPRVRNIQMFSIKELFAKEKLKCMQKTTIYPYKKRKHIRRRAASSSQLKGSSVEKLGGRGHVGSSYGEEILHSHCSLHGSLQQYQVGSWDWGKSVSPSGSLVERSCTEQSYSAWHFRADFLVEWGGFWNLQAHPWWPIPPTRPKKLNYSKLVRSPHLGWNNLCILCPNLDEQMFFDVIIGIVKWQGTFEDESWQALCTHSFILLIIWGTSH